MKFSDLPSSSVGKATASASANLGGDKKTWDGYGTFNNIPFNPDKANVPAQPQMSKEELLREKFKVLRKLEALEKKGIDLSKKYTMDSSLQEMMGEYETILDEKSKSNSIKFQANMLMSVINGIEFLNNRFDPFDIKLDGWSEQVSENVSDFDDIFGALHEKYKSKASMAPEIQLLFQLGGSAMMVHMTNTMFKSAMPGMDDILRQNPDLMRSFQTAAVNSMSGSNPGFSGFVNNMMAPEQPQVGGGGGGRGPPPPMQTQGPHSSPPPAMRPGNNNYANRADLNYSKSHFTDDGISLRENSEPMYQERRETSEKRQTSSRAEMKGPSDINDILSGLKTKSINIQNPVQASGNNIGGNNSGGGGGGGGANNVNANDSSTISITDLKDLQGDAMMPKKSRRKQKSATNTVSLDF